MQEPYYYTKGFTLMEIIIVIAIITTFGTSALVLFSASRNTRDLTTSAQDTLSVLRLAHARTLAGENDSAWGVRLASNQITLFQGDTFAGSPLTKIYALPNSMQITNIILNGGGIDVIFKRVTGETDQTGTFLLSVIGSPSNSFAVTIDSLGKVYQTNTFPPATITRTVDTRHRSFTLGWSIRTPTAITMTLTFADPAVVQPVIMLPFFDAGKTKFDWSGTVSVGGLNQVLRIHTTTLTDANTVLSIDRDCRKNTKKLTIDIDGKAIATYEADCITIGVGAYGGTISEP